MAIVCPIKNRSECSQNDLKVEEQSFIIMDYKGKHSTAIRNMLQESVQKAFDLTPILASEVRQDSSSDLFCTRICQQIQKSKLCIADLTYENTNVGLEIGIAQMIGKQVILTLHKKWREEIVGGKNTLSLLPTDFAGRYVVTYENSEVLTQKLSNFDVRSSVSKQRIMYRPFPSITPTGDGIRI